MNQDISRECAQVLLAIESARERFRQLHRAAATAEQALEHELHHAFASLYYLTTMEWARFARTSPLHDFFEELILHFFQLYEFHVSANVGSSDLRAVAPHWYPYFSLIRRTDRFPRTCIRKAGVFFAARAHTRFDLRDAIVLAYRARAAQGRTGPDPKSLSGELLGQESSRLFSKVALSYMAGNREGGARRLPLVSEATAWGRQCIGPAWLMWFQRWRQCAFQEALEEIRRGDGLRPPAPASPRGPHPRP